jgi:acyl-CoA thioesterase-1
MAFLQSAARILDRRIAMRPARKRNGSYGRSRGGHQRVAILLACLATICIASGSAQARTVKLVALGDSLTAGYQLPADAAFPAKLETALRAKGYDVAVANAGVSGDTTAGGLARLDWSVPDGTDAVIVELGANDMLRGFDPAMTQRTLATIIERLQARHMKVMLAGMLANPTLGRDFKAQFDAIYPELAQKYGIILYPFFLDGVAAQPGMQLADGLHPSVAGVDVIVARILPSVEALLKQVGP